MLCAGCWAGAGAKDSGRGPEQGGYFPGCFAPAAWRKLAPRILGGGQGRADISQGALRRLLGGGWRRGFWEDPSRVDLSQDALFRLQVEDWECQQLQEPVRLEELPIDPAPYRLLEKETLYQCYDLFNLLGLRTAYVTNVGRLVGVVSLRELKAAVEGSVKGTFPRCRERDGDPDPNGASA
ncbi:hypothetical protein KIL84_020633 [Mauremys mutica]|uniref:CBS domain-containing protein n=1 Tax=Mauremys mutica TaxID=74926 RepID=A0A9D3XXR8_9SAUR|nr:hypothetical protein KIL84_020633 [Mauremys mutica]